MRWIIAFVAPLLVSAEVSARPAVQYFNRPGTRPPFSAAVRAGDTLYLSGMIGARPDGTLPEGIEAQTRQAMENLRQNLALAGSDFSQVVRCTAMLENMSDWATFNHVYTSYFQPGRLPARSAFGVDGLAFGSLVEIECQAHAQSQPRH